MVLRQLSALAIVALLFGFAVIGPFGWPNEVAAAGLEPEIGIWRCAGANYGSCPPDGLGRGRDDFWTDPSIAQSDKIGVSCRLEGSEPWRGVYVIWGQDICHGTYWHDYWCPDQGIAAFCRRVDTTMSWSATLRCPEGYAETQGHCVEISPPRADENCSLPAGSPVNAVTGRNDQMVTDWGGPPAVAQSSGTAATSSRLELRRYYSSHFAGLATPAQSRLGNGWRTGFDAVAVWNGTLASARRIHVVLPDFTEITYAFEYGMWRPKDSYDWSRPRTDVTATLTVNAGTVTLRQADGTRYVFNATGQLRQIIAPDGYTQTLFYRGTLNTWVSDSRGSWIELFYGAEGSPLSGLLTVVRTSGRKSIIYKYEDRSQAGRAVKDKLTSGTNQWALKSVIYPNSTAPLADNPQTVYHYLDNMYRPYLITAAVNRPSVQPSTWTATKWTYDVKKRVTSVESTGGYFRWEYTYDDPNNRVRITDPTGGRALYNRMRDPSGLQWLSPVDAGLLTRGKPFSPTSATGNAENENICSYIPKPPGDCTPEQHSSLQSQVDFECGQTSNLRRTCKTQGLTRAEYFDRMIRNANCAAARNRINATCYRGGNPTHRNEERIATELYKECAEKVRLLDLYPR
jgi:YD repeat-containing protein